MDKTTTSSNEDPPIVEAPAEASTIQNDQVVQIHDDDEESDYEYESDDDYGGFLVASSNPKPEALPTQIEEEPGEKKWREPTKEAVTMSLRAEKETSGGKRRLAQDLYRIMNQDTDEAGFSLEPSNEDSMDKWTIKLFKFDEDSNLAKDMQVLGVQHVELEMTFPEQYPFEPPFVRVSKPRFKKQTGFVMNGALCMELLTSDGWNPINDIESVIVSIRSLLVVGDGRLEAAASLPEEKYQTLLAAADSNKRQRTNSQGDSAAVLVAPSNPGAGGSYSVSEAKSAYAHLSDYHKKKGWDVSGWWAKKG